MYDKLSFIINFLKIIMIFNKIINYEINSLICTIIRVHWILSKIVMLMWFVMSSNIRFVALIALFILYIIVWFCFFFVHRFNIVLKLNFFVLSICIDVIHIH